MTPRYRKYLESDAWRRCAARLQELESAQHRCRLCDRGPPEVSIQVHHRSYERLGAELVSDLTALCSECHEGVTDILRARRYALTAVPVPVQVVSALPGRRLTDSTEVRDVT